MRVNLVVIEGVQQGKVIPLNTERFEIGRGKDCQLRPKSPTVSIRQCAILRRGRHVIVEDLGSTNGTLVNERCLKMGDEVRISHGDRLQVGQLIFVFQIESGPGGVEDALEGWLTAAPNLGHASEVDMSSQTMMIAVPAATVPFPADRVRERAATPSPSPDVSVLKFAYRFFDERHKVVVLGLSQEQVNDDEGARSLRKTLFGLVMKKKVRRMVLDLGAVEDLHSLALAVLLAAAHRCEEENGELRLCAVSPSVRRLVTALRFDKVMASYDDKDKAVVAPWR